MRKIRLLVFTEGTILMHKNAAGYSREEIIKQVKEKENSVSEYDLYIPVGNAAQKITAWKNNCAEIIYLTSRRKNTEIQAIRKVLSRYCFPKGRLLHRIKNETYANVAERIKPDILIEDDCESIGGAKEMTITNIRPDIKKKIKPVVVKEFSGIDTLPDNWC